MSTQHEALFDSDSGIQQARCHHYCSQIFRRLRKELLLILITIGVIIGFVVGASINGHIKRIKDAEEKETLLMLIYFPGELFMNMLKVLILPLIIASLMCALSTLDSKASSRVGRRTLIYYLGTTILAVGLGIVLAVTIKPGIHEGESERQIKKLSRTLDVVLDLIRSFFPDNIIEFTFRQETTKYIHVDAKWELQNSTEQASQPNMSLVHGASDTVPTGRKVDPAGSMNVLGVVIFSIVFGILLSRLGERGLPIKAVIQSLNEVILGMVAVVMWFAPIGVCSLIAARLARMQDIWDSLRMLSMYMVTVIAGLMIHTFITLPLMYLVVKRQNPYKFMAGMRDAVVTAFGTASSSATLPVTLRCVENNNNVDIHVSRFVLPLGASVNMDGTALYEAVSALFIAQANNINLTVPEIIITSLTATAVSIGAAGIPQAGLVTMVLVLQSVGLPTDYIGLILAVDWFLDRIRTLTNILGCHRGRHRGTPIT